VAAVSGVRKRSFQRLPGVIPSPAATRVERRESHLPAGCGGQHRPCRGPSRSSLIRRKFPTRSCCTISGGARSDDVESAGRGHRHAVSLGHSLHSEAQKTRRRKSKLEAQANSNRHRHGNSAAAKSSIRRTIIRIITTTTRRSLIARQSSSPKVEKIEKKLKEEKPCFVCADDEAFRDQVNGAATPCPLVPTESLTTEYKLP